MPLAALREILAAADFRPSETPDIRGADPVLRTRYRVGAAGAAALGALGLAAAHLWQLRGGRAQRVAVDVRAAAASLRSARYLRIDGKPLPPPWDPLSGFYPVRDGWVSIHCNFANHRDAALGVLGTGADRAAAEQASRAWDGHALEDAIHATGGCAGFVRSRVGWARHPQAQAVAGAAAPRDRAHRRRAARAAAGGGAPARRRARARPHARARRADLRAQPRRARRRRAQDQRGAPADSGLVELDTGIGKLSARLDLRTPAGVDALARARARGGRVLAVVPARRARRARVLAEALAELRPGIVCVSLSAWGGTGPWRERRGFDSIVQAVSGMALASGEGGKPQLLPVSAIDYVSGYLMAFGAMVALARRAEEGGSWLVRVALARVGKWIVDRGTLPEERWRGLPDDLPPERARAAARRDGRAGRPHPLPAPGRAALRDAAVLEPAAGAARLPSAAWPPRG